MNIVINRNIDQELLSLKIRNERLRIEKLGSLLLLLGLSFLGYHYITRDVNKSNWDTTDVGMAIVFIFFGYRILYSYYKYQKRFRAGAGKSKEKYSELDVFSTITLTDEVFLYESVKSSIKLSWSSISTFKIYKGHLILTIDAYFSPAFVIMNNEVDSQQLTTLYVFVSKNVKQVK
jgi:hypothetical protein